MFPTSVAHQAANGRRARMLIRWLTQQFQVDSIRTLCTCNKTTKQITLGTQFTVGLILDFTKCEHLRGIVRAQYAVSTFSKKLRFGLLRFKFVKPGIRTQLLGSLHSDT